ncbi:MAG: histidine phosphatase family protein [Pseudomonadota bacterium]
MTRLRILLAALAAALLLPLAPQAQEEGWQALQRPGVVVLLRHARAPGTGDPAEFRLGDCTTQRNLDAAGREQARRIGEALRARGFEPDEILTSRWCRCRETAELLDLGPVEPFPPLDSFFRDRSTAEAQTRAVLDHLAARPEGTESLLVTHQVNITALTGVHPSSGEAIIAERDADGALTVLSRALVSP